MIYLEDRPWLSKPIDIKLEFTDLAAKIQMSATNPAIIDAAKTVFDAHKGIWQPSSACRWMQFDPGNSDDSGWILCPQSPPLEIQLGYSKRFLAHAHYVLAAVYTAGPELDEASARASREGDFLGAHFLDLLGLLVLEKTERIVKNYAQNQAREAGWGVSPFLSPGSVHGWNLEDQSKLAGLLPIEDIGVSLLDASIFSPFKTISCLIGIGPDYKEDQVGTTCRVCSKRDTCQLRLNQNPGH